MVRCQQPAEERRRPADGVGRMGSSAVGEGESAVSDRRASPKLNTRAGAHDVPMRRSDRGAGRSASSAANDAVTVRT